MQHYNNINIGNIPSNILVVSVSLCYCNHVFFFYTILFLFTRLDIFIRDGLIGNQWFQNSINPAFLACSLFSFKCPARVFWQIYFAYVYIKSLSGAIYLHGSVRVRIEVNTWYCMCLVTKKIFVTFVYNIYWINVCVVDKLVVFVAEVWLISKLKLYF